MISHRNILQQKNKTCFTYHQKANTIRKLYYQRLLYTISNRSMPDISSQFGTIDTRKIFSPISISYLTQKTKQHLSEESFNILVKETPDPLCDIGDDDKYGFWYTTKINSSQIQAFIDSLTSLRGYRMVFMWEQIIFPETSVRVQL